MDLANAIEIIRALADGRDPATGQPFLPDSPYQQTDTVRALFTALEALEQCPRRREAWPVDPNKPKVGSSWTPEEEQQLRDAFAAHNTQSENLPIAAKEAAFAAWRNEVAAAHGRSAGAITARLMKIGLLAAAGAHTPYPPRYPVQPPEPIAPPAPSANPTAADDFHF